MTMDVKVIPNARKNAIKKEHNGWKIHLASPAIDGKANKALIAFLAEHFCLRKSDIHIIKGLKSRNKTININGDFA